LFRTYLVFTFTSFPTIVDASPQLLSALTRSSIPGLKTITEWGIRQTFFKQFVGGESVVECEQVMQEMRERGVGTLLAHSVEVDESAPFSTITGLPNSAGVVNVEELHETLRAIEQAASFERKMEQQTGSGTGSGGMWLAVKITGLVRDPELLHRVSNTLIRLRDCNSNSRSTSIPYPGTPTPQDGQLITTTQTPSISHLSSGTDPAGNGAVLHGEEGVTKEDELALMELWAALKTIGETAKQHGIKIAIDAEHTWYQPALDVYTMMLSQEFNKLPTATSQDAGPSPLIYGTYQCYLTRTPDHIEASMAHAKANNYVLGLKLVRGAYHEQERRRWVNDGRAAFGADPIWPDKSATDKCYNAALHLVLDKLAEDIAADRPPQLGVFFGTHNGHSVDLVLRQLEAKGLAEKTKDGRLRPADGLPDRVCIGQLYGMSDELTERIANAFATEGTPMVLKYLPYGQLSEVLPYLGRRAIENKALLSGDSGTTAERRRVVAELKRRIGWSSQHKQI